LGAVSDGDTLARLMAALLMDNFTQPGTGQSASNSVEETHWSSTITFWVAAALVGMATSLLVWAFMNSFSWLNRLTFGAFGSLPAPAGQIATALIPAIGGLLVAFFMHALTRPDKLAAMANVIDGVTVRGGRLNYSNSFVFIIGSLIGIGFGAPVGEDTPSAMIGGHIGSLVAGRLHWKEDYVRALVVAGVGAGISATYFAQLAAVFFALEVVLGGFGGVLFVVPTLIAVAFSAIVSFLLSGAPVQYTIPAGGLAWNWTLLLQIGAALLAALAAIIYVNLLPAMKRWWSKVRLPFWAKAGLAGLMVGIVGIKLPDIFGTGVTQMDAIFRGNIQPFSILIALLIAKIILTPNSLGAGFVGGAIGPALMIGASLGAAYGEFLVRLIPGTTLSPVVFAMLATAAMLAGTFHAPLFGAMMIYEMSGNYELLLPLLFAAAIGYGVAKPFQPGSAYTFVFKPMGVKFIPGTFQESSESNPRIN
jgi:chloride channel protein, CIC family